MRIEKVRLRNYKSIVDSENICFHDKFTVLAGKNNTGKTALIEAIYRAFQGQLDIPISRNVIPGTGINQNVPVVLEVVINFKNNEEFMNHIPPNLQTNRYVFVLKCWNGLTSILELRQLLNDNHEHTIIRWQETESRYEYITEQNVLNYIATIPNYLRNLYSRLQASFIYISGTRSVPMNPNITTSHQLDNSASNFHTFMQTLHNNREEVFDKIQETFVRIFSDVRIIRTPINGNTTNVHLSFDGMIESIPLQECGSGFTHVLVMLCVLHSEVEKVVLFDEPHVYLHPSAEKAIYDLANAHESHQFVFTTHSPILINYPVPKKLFLVTKENGSTMYSQLDEMQEVLKEIGVVNSDFALSDKVLFVEGETEESILPMILERFGMKQFGYNYKIINLKGTGNEFKNKSGMSNNAQKLERIFSSLASDRIPYCILLDRDERDEEKIEELKQKYKDTVLILERRELENYFLQFSDPLVSILKEKTETEPSKQEVDEFIQKCIDNIEDRKLFPKERQNPINDVVGSEVLERLFDKYDQIYSKVYHGTIIAKWLLENHPEQLRDITELVRPFIHGKIQ